MRFLPLMGSLLCGPIDTLKGAPITFRFDAEITNLLFETPFNLRLEYGVGDRIQGKFTFEPGPGIPINSLAVSAEQPYALEFDIHGTAVNTAGYTIRAFNDSIPYDSELEIPRDGITLGCREASCIPNIVTLPGGEPFKVRSEMSLFGDSSVWSTPSIISDSETWNAFALRRHMTLAFDDLGPGIMGFDAVIGQIVQVPESSSINYVMLSLMYIMPFRRERAVDSNSFRL
jgi:hypothetical protein